ncbi:MAG: response regulator [Myxococcales bacterium]|nr:response regulator [Myxococcales bacterium]
MTEERRSCLVVEDSPMMRRLLVYALSRAAPMDFVEAENGLVALQRLGQKSFDLIVTDLNMPVMDGLKLIDRVRTDPVHAKTPIVVVTTETGEQDRTRALSLGANVYVNKPIQAPEIMRAARRALGMVADL